MIMTVEELKKFVNTSANDDTLELMLESIESFIVNYTNNSFTDRITGVEVYPPDIKLGVINLCKWDLENRDKVGIASESVSRHSVTYFSMDGENAALGYPISLLGFLKNHMRARF